MTLNISFLSAVALDGLAFLLGTVIVRKVPAFQKIFLPAPIIGGLIFAIGFLILRIAGVTVSIPNSGYLLDFFAALLTANMGLHVSWKILRQEGFLFFVVLGLAFILYFFILIVVSPLSGFGAHWMERAIVMGPLSFTGAPFNLNPPNQVTPWFAQLLRPGFPGIPVTEIKPMAQGQMMIGVLIGMFLTGIIGRKLFERARSLPPRPSPSDRYEKATIWVLTTQETGLLVLVLVLVALSFPVQSWLLSLFPSINNGVIPTIVLAYLFGVIFRLTWDLVMPKPKAEFPTKALSVLLFGPTMGLTLTYPIMVLPLFNLRLLNLPMIIAGFLAIAVSALMAWFVVYPLFCRFVDHYYAVVISTAFLAITTGWGPIGMVYLRRFTDDEGPVPPMPIILPVNAFFAIPWLVTLTSVLVLHFIH